MNFLERIERDMQDRRGRGDEAVVSHNALRELVHHFKVLDSEMRAGQSVAAFRPDQHLANAVTAAFHASNGSTEEITRLVVNTLHELTRHERYGYRP